MTFAETIHHYSKRFPFPIAHSLNRYETTANKGLWEEWEVLSHDILQSVLMYLSHIVLSDLVASGKQPAHLYHRIQSILSRPMSGHYVGFLRETARYFRDEKVESAVPDLINFLIASDVDCDILHEKKPLLGLLVDYRNLWAHGKIDNVEMIENTVSEIRRLTGILLRNLEFMEQFPLQLADGTKLMGAIIDGISKEVQPIELITSRNITIRPMLLKLKGEDIVLLDDADIKDKKISYRGSNSYHQFKKKDIEKGDAKDIYEALKDLLAKVRSLDAPLELKDISWENFNERAWVQTDQTLSLYSDMRKFVPELYVARGEWEGDENVFDKFLGSDKTVLSINGVQGTGKSALVARLAQRSLMDGNAVLFINAQRFSFANVKFRSVNPYPEYFSQMLHYNAPFGKEALQRIIKSAEAGKKVILFIDAINEVDGLENKWNRFKAMELLLEWIQEIAQPNLKIVLSFRLEVYEKYDYLQDEELPKNWETICFEGNNPRKKWVQDLAPFDELQAKALFEKLQGKSELGMMPAMTWEEIHTGLGDHLNEIIDNPLIFTVFLRAHNGENKILNTDRDAIFFQYTEKLTGAIELKTWSWWKKIWGFIKDGNITKKEMLLADMVGTLAKEGGAAFLVERLSQKNKRDKRIMTVLDDTQDPIFRELRDGGIIVEEKIEISRGNDITYSRRITFVSELLAVAMNTILLKTRKMYSFRRNLIQSIFTACMYCGFLFPFSYFIGVIIENRGGVFSAKMIMDLSIGIFAPICLAFFVFDLSGPLSKLIFTEEKRSIIGKDIDHFESTVGHSRYSKSFIILIQVLFRYALPGILIMLVVLFYDAFEFQENNIVNKYLLMKLSSAPTLSFIVGTIILINTPSWIGRIELIPIQNYPQKVLKSYFAAIHRFNSRKDIIKDSIFCGIRNFVFYVFSFTCIILMCAYWYAEPEIIFPNYDAMGLEQMFPILLATQVNSGSVWMSDVILLTLPYSVTFVSILFFFGTIFPRVIRRRYLLQWEIKRNLRPLTKKEEFNIKFVIPGVFFFIGIIVLIIFYYQNVNAANDEKILQELPEKPEEYHINTVGECTFLDVSNLVITESDWRIIEKLNWLDTLILPNQKNMIVNKSVLSQTTNITLPVNCLNILSKTDLFGNTLSLYNANEIDTSKSFFGLKEVEIMGQCENLDGISVVFKYLPSLTISEGIGSAIKHMPSFQRNMYLKIKSDDSLRLDWLTNDFSRYILKFDKPFTKNVQNLDKLDRVFIDRDDVDPEILKKAINIRWLLLTHRKKKSSEYYSSLLTSLNENNKIQVLEFATLEKNKHKIAFSTRGKEAINQLLQKLAKQPELFDPEKILTES